MEQLYQIQGPARIPPDVDAALAAGEHKEVALVVPTYLVDLKLELLLCLSLEGPDIDEGHKIFLVTHRDRLTIGRPTDVDVLTERTGRHTGRDTGVQADRQADIQTNI